MNHTKEELLRENCRLRSRLAEEQQKARKMETRCYCWWCRVVDWFKREFREVKPQPFFVEEVK